MSRLPGARAKALISASVLLGSAACVPPPLHPPAHIAAHQVNESDTSFTSLGENIRVDVYRPTTPGHHPAAIVLHGGGGIHAIAPGSSNRYGRTLAELGMEAFVVHYFDATGHITAGDDAEREYYFHWVQVAKDAVTFARAQANVETDRISLVGISLGAWVSVGAGAIDHRIHRLALFGAGLEPFLVDSLKRAPPTLLFHGDSDSVVPLSDAQHLEAAMHANGRHVELVVYPREGHDLDDSAATDALVRAARFLTAPRFSFRER